MSTGRFTIPSEENFAEKTKELADLWGADAIRAVQITSRFPAVHGAPIHIDVIIPQNSAGCSIMTEGPG